MLVNTANTVLLLIALLWLVAASSMDMRKREVADWLSFSLIAAGLGIRGVAALYVQNASYFLYGLIGLGGFFVLANLLYYGRIFAGGDAKLLMALGVIFATPLTATTATLTESALYLGLFALNSLLIGSVYGIGWTTVLAIKHRSAFITEATRIGNEKKIKNVRTLFLLVAAVLLVFTLATGLFPLAALGLVILALPYLYIFIKAVEKTALIRRINPDQLTEGDLLIKEVKVKAEKIIKPNWEGLSKADIAAIRAAKKVKSVLIKQGIPFVPVFLIAAIVMLLFF